MTRPRKPRPILTADDALAATRHLILGHAPTRPRRCPIPCVVLIEGLPTPRPSRPGLAGVTEVYYREWRARHRNGGRERDAKGGAA